MGNLGDEVLSDCQSDCLKIFNEARELRGESKQSIFEMAEFKNIKRKILARNNKATDRDVLAFILRKTALFLRKS